MLNIGLPPVQTFHLGRIGVKAQDLESHLTEAQHQGQTHVSQADDAHQSLPIFDFFQQLQF